MSNPTANIQFKHYLNFKNDDLGLFQIADPLKFDASEFIIEQDSKLYARDISFMNEEIDLQFIEGFFGLSDEPYQTLSGAIVSNLSHCLDYILEYNKRYGFQSQVEYILERNGTQFIIGELSFEGADTDELTYFNCKVIQNTKKALAKRREDLEIDGFATEDIDGNPITPLTTYKLLLKSKPDVQVSEWNHTANDNAYSRNFYINGSRTDIQQSCMTTNSPIVARIENTLSFLTTSLASVGGTPTLEGFTFIEALNELSNITVNISDVNAFCTQRVIDFFGDEVLSGSGYVRLVLKIGTSINSITESYILHQKDFSYVQSPFNDGNEDYQFPTDFTVNLESINSGERVYIYFEAYSDAEFHIENPNATSTLVSYNLNCIVSNAKVEMKATSTAIDTVVDACKYDDVLKHSLKAINGMDMEVPEFNNGGKFHNLFVFSGNMIRQRTDVPFYFNFKDRRDSFYNLTNGDVQINDDSAFAIQYDKFYANVENGAFLSATNDSFSMNFNKRYTVNLVDFSFKDYEKDDDEENTLDAVHTESQSSINNTRVQTTKKIEVSDIFDPFRIEKQRRDSYKETTALEGDDKIHGIDAVSLPPNARGGFTASMTHNINSEGKVQLMKESDLPSWGLLGFSVGSPFKILSSLNFGNYEVFEIDTTIITLTPISPTVQSGTGVALTQVDYPFDNVLYTNRTNEGFDIIENLLSPNNFSNLRYTIRRIFENWESYFSTCASFITDPIKNTMFKNNGLLRTQYNGGPIYVENGDIELSSLKERILSPREYEVSVIADYDKVLDIIAKYQQIETAGGFLRVQGAKGDIKKLYPSKLTYKWVDELLTIVGEERREPEFITVTRVGDIIEIDEVGYELEQLSEVFYEANGDYFTLLDNSNIKIINFTKYDRFIVQGQTFDNTTDLSQALIDL